MTKLAIKRSKKAGFPPGSLIHIGEQKIEEARVTVVVYDQNVFQVLGLDEMGFDLSERAEQPVTWVNVDGIHQKDVVERIGKQFNLHPLLLEDIMNTDQRPKLEYYDDYIFLVLKVLSYSGQQNRINYEQVSLVLGCNFVISFQEGGEDIFGGAREALKDAKGRIRKMGADYLIYSLIDVVIDNYFGVMEKVGENIEVVEDELVKSPNQGTVRSLHNLKREVIVLRKAVWPLREVIGDLERRQSTLIHEATTIYLRDVYDHIIHVIDTIETFRDMLSGMLDIYLSSVSNRLNEVMKVLTIIATIFIPLTWIAGIYGMNFQYMPELKMRWGYPIVLLVMMVIAILMLIYFKKKKWF